MTRITYDFSGETAIVTGGAAGIGRAIADRLYATGANVHVWDRMPLEPCGISSSIVDVTIADQIGTALEEVLLFKEAMLSTVS